MRVDIDIRDLNKAINKIQAWETRKIARVRDTVNESALNVQKGAKKRCPVDTGRLRSSITIQPMDFTGMRLKVGTKVKYAADVEFGTGPRTITPKRAKALRFEVNGQVLFRRKVNHPGTRAQPYLFPAWEEERPKLIQNLRGALRND